MRLSKDLTDKAIVTLDEGRILGHVKDLYLTPDLSELAGIFLKKEGLFRRKTIVVPADAVVLFGIDVVLIKAATAVTDDKSLTEVEDWVRIGDLEGREIDTPGGTRVGTIGDVMLDENGSVTAYALSRVLVEGPIAESRLIYRHAVVDDGRKDGVMTVDIARAENPDFEAPTPVSPPVLEAAAVDEEVSEEPVPTQTELLEKRRKAEATAADEPAADEPAADEPAADEPVADDNLDDAVVIRTASAEEAELIDAAANRQDEEQDTEES